MPVDDGSVLSARIVLPIDSRGAEFVTLQFSYRHSIQEKLGILYHRYRSCHWQSGKVVGDNRTLTFEPATVVQA